MTRTFKAADGEPMSEVLSDFIGWPVTVKLKDGRTLTGQLWPEELDDYGIYTEAGELVTETFDHADVLELSE